MAKCRQNLLFHALAILTILLFAVQLYHYDYPTRVRQRKMESMHETIHYHSEEAEFAKNVDGQVEFFQVPGEFCCNVNISNTLLLSTPSKRTFSDRNTWVYRLMYKTKDGTFIIMVDEYGLMNVNGEYYVCSDEYWFDVRHNFNVIYDDARNGYADEILTCSIEAYPKSP